MADPKDVVFPTVSGASVEHVVIYEDRGLDPEEENVLLRECLHSVLHEVEPLIGLLRLRDSDPLKARADAVSEKLTQALKLLPNPILGVVEVPKK